VPLNLHQRLNVKVSELTRRLKFVKKFGISSILGIARHQLVLRNYSQKSWIRQIKQLLMISNEDYSRRSNPFSIIFSRFVKKFPFKCTPKEHNAENSKLLRFLYCWIPMEMCFRQRRRYFIASRYLRKKRRWEHS